MRPGRLHNFAFCILHFALSSVLYIISGKAKGRKLHFPDTDKCRPSTEKVREAIEATLKPFLTADTQVLDLFAGSGALGMELISLGAASCVFVDLVTYSIEGNITRLNWEASCKIWRGDALRYLSTHRSARFDIICLDPPYAKDNLLDTTLNTIAEFKTLQPYGVIVIEHAMQHKVTAPAAMKVCRVKVYGSSQVSYVVHEAYDPFQKTLFQVAEFT